MAPWSSGAAIGGTAGDEVGNAVAAAVESER